MQDKISPSSTPPSSVRALLVEDEDPLRRALARGLERVGYRVETAESGLRARELVAGKEYQVIVSDVAMPGIDGRALLRMVREHDMEVPVVLMTGHPEVSTAEAAQYGACQYLTKPVELAQRRRGPCACSGYGFSAKIVLGARPRTGSTSF